MTSRLECNVRSTCLQHGVVIVVVNSIDFFHGKVIVFKLSDVHITL